MTMYYAFYSNLWEENSWVKWAKQIILEEEKLSHLKSWHMGACPKWYLIMVGSE